jgi:hypothetical protein
LTGGHGGRDDSDVAARIFTLAEANELLDELRPLAERLVERRHALAEAAESRGAIAGQIAGNGGGLEPQDLVDVHEALEREAGEIARLVEEIQSHGVLVKDLDRGLLDFPALRGDEEVLLCWQVGEDEIAYWHGTEEGFAGRKPLD